MGTRYRYGSLGFCTEKRVLAECGGVVKKRVWLFIALPSNGSSFKTFRLRHLRVLIPHLAEDYRILAMFQNSPHVLLQ